MTMHSLECGKTYFPIALEPTVAAQICGDDTPQGIVDATLGGQQVQMRVTLTLREGSCILAQNGQDHLKWACRINIATGLGNARYMGAMLWEGSSDQLERFPELAA